MSSLSRRKTATPLAKRVAMYTCVYTCVHLCVHVCVSYSNNGMLKKTIPKGLLERYNRESREKSRWTHCAPLRKQVMFAQCPFRTFTVLYLTWSGVTRVPSFTESCGGTQADAAAEKTAVYFEDRSINKCFHHFFVNLPSNASGMPKLLFQSLSSVKYLNHQYWPSPLYI